MGLPTTTLIKIISTVLNQLLDGDKGSTVLGLIAGGLLSANIDFGKVLMVLQSPTQDNCVEAAKALAVVAVVMWGYFTGKKPPGPKQTDQTPPGAALAH